MHAVKDTVDQTLICSKGHVDTLRGDVLPAYTTCQSSQSSGKRSGNALLKDQENRYTHEVKNWEEMIVN